MKKHISYIILAGVLFATLSFVVPANAQPIPTITIDKPIIEMTIPELQAKIAEILQAIQQLQALIAQMTTQDGLGSSGIDISGIPSSYTFNTNLTYGSSSNEVKYLQIILNADPDTRVSTTGFGSPGNESMYFGNKTKQAIIKFQTKYKTDISSIVGYTIKGTGYLGKGTRTMINQLLGQYRSGDVAPVVPPDTPIVEIDDGSFCGDNIIQTPNFSGVHEVCDNTSLNNQTCSTRGYFSGTLSCSNTCLVFDTSNCLSVSGTTGGTTPTSPSTPVVTQPVVIVCGDNTDNTCPSGCTYPQDTDCTYCGDNILQTPNDGGITEVCDNTSLNSQTCSTKGFPGGTLLCSNTCLTFNTSQCVLPEPPNQAPVLDSIGDKSTSENQEISFNVSGTDTDNDTLAYSVQDIPSGATFTDQTFTWTPTYIQSGTYDVIFTVSDSNLTDTETITITVGNVNRAPTLNTIGDKSTNENQTITFTISGTDVDNDPLFYSTQDRPTGASFNTATRTFTWTPTYTQSGTYSVTFIVSDTEYIDQETISINVSDVVQNFTLTVSTTNGSVSRSPNQAVYTSGTVVTLTATPDSGYTFSNWSGDLTGTSSPATITMDNNKSVSANFSVVAVTPVCGDNTCNGIETCSSCPGDCGACGAGCTVTIFDSAGLILEAQTANPGDIICLSDGNYGDVVFDDSVAVGNSGGWITYRGVDMSNKPNLTSLTFTGTSRNVYLRFEGIRFDPGYVSSAKHAVGLNNVNYVEFDSSYFESAKIAGSINNGDFAPYVFGNDGTFFTSFTSGNPSYITIKNSNFLYGYNVIRLVSGNNWNIINNSITEFGDNGIQIAGDGGDDTQIIGNKIHHSNKNRCTYHWLGTATGDWSDKQWQTVTQDNTGASGIFYEFSVGRIFIYPDDFSNIPFRNNNDIWRLDSDPNIYWTPLGNGDDCHSDHISIEGSSVNNVIVDSNYLYEATGQIIKVGTGSPQNIVIKNNIIYDLDAGTYIVLLGGGTISLYNNVIDSGDDVTTPDYDSRSARGIRALGDSSLELEIYNNIISGAVYTDGNVYSDYNIWLQTPPAQFNEGTNSLVNQDFNSGMFIDRVGADYQLIAGSSAIDIASLLYAPIEDILGNLRDANPDAGAYEYQGAGSCSGTDTSCGIWPNCQNYNTQDTCIGTTYRDYYCVSNDQGSSYTEDDCSDCSCSCGGYNQTESIANNNCSDGIDNNCNGLIDSQESACQVVVCTSGQTQSCDTGGQGECSTGTETCQPDNTWGSCVQDNQPITEDCTDSLDNDCDGLIDCNDTSCSTDFACQVAGIPTDYISYWKFDGDATDEKENNDGTIYGNPQYVTGVQGQALDFYNVGDYVDIGTISLGGDVFTFVAWTMASGGGNQTIIGGSSNGYPQFRLSGNQDLLSAGSKLIGSSNTSVSTDVWSQVVVTFDGTNYNFYLNGQSDGSGSNATTFGTQAVTRIGTQRTTMEEFNGQIDEVMIYNRALSASEIQDIYDAQKPGASLIRRISQTDDLTDEKISYFASILSSIRSAIQDMLEKIKNLF